MKELQKKEFHLPKIIIKKEDQAMDPDNGITIKTLVTDLIPIIGRRTRTVDDYWTGDQTKSLIGTMEIDRIMGISIVKVELGEIMKSFLVHPLDKDGTFLKVILSVDLSLFSLESRHLEDQMLTQSLVPLLTNRNFRKATIKHQRTWFASPPLMIVLTNYQNSVR